MICRAALGSPESRVGRTAALPMYAREPGLGQQ